MMVDYKTEKNMNEKNTIAQTKCSIAELGSRVCSNIKVNVQNMFISVSVACAGAVTSRRVRSARTLTSAA